MTYEIKNNTLTWKHGEFDCDTLGTLFMEQLVPEWTSYSRQGDTCKVFLATFEEMEDNLEALGLRHVEQAYNEFCKVVEKDSVQTK